MNSKKKAIMWTIVGVVGIALVGCIAYLYITLDNQQKENKAMQELKDDGTIQSILDKYIKAE